MKAKMKMAIFIDPAFFSSISFLGGINHMREQRRAYGSQFSVPSCRFWKLKLVFMLGGRWPYMISHLAGFIQHLFSVFFFYFFN